MNCYNPGFDLDLAFGEAIEEEFQNIVNGHKVEVKHDRKSIYTKNLCVEIQCNGKPSGIVSSKASLFYFQLVGLDTGILIQRTRLLTLCRKFKDNLEFGGDNNASVFILIPLKEIYELN